MPPRSPVAILVIALCASSALAAPAQRLVHPATYFAGANDYRLSVEGHHRFGLGLAEYELWQGDRLAWAGTMPWTLFDAAVGTDGVVIGYAYVPDVPRFRELLLIAIDPNGDVVLEETVRRTSPGPCAGPAPGPGGLAIDDDARRLGFALLSGSGRLSCDWYVYDLRGGERLDPADAPELCEMLAADVRRIRERTKPKRWAPEPWGGNRWGWESWGRDRWIVDHLEPSRLARLAELPLPAIEGDDEARAESAHPKRVAFDELGRTCVADPSTEQVHVYDRSGALLFRCRPLGSDIEGAFAMPRVIVGSPDGSLYLEASAPLLRRGGYVHFDSGGGRLGLEELDPPRFTFGRLRWSWDAHGGRVVRIDSGGVVDLAIERRADGRWFGDIEAVAVANDGSIAIFESGAQRERDPALALYFPDGTPRTTIPLPIDTGTTFARLSYGGDWAVAWDMGTDAVLIDLRGPDLYRLELPWLAAVRIVTRDEELSSRGAELWTLSPADLVVRKFALP